MSAVSWTRRKSGSEAMEGREEAKDRRAVKRGSGLRRTAWP